MKRKKNDFASNMCLLIFAYEYSRGARRLFCLIYLRKKEMKIEDKKKERKGEEKKRKWENWRS